MLEAKIPSINTNVQAVTATTENSKAQPQSTKCAKFGRYSLYALPVPVGSGFLSKVLSAKCGASVFASTMFSTGVASCSFVSCTIMYFAHSLSERKTKVENEAKPDKNTEGYAELLKLTDVITEQPESNTDIDEVSMLETDYSLPFNS
jgi:hypothetical protein